MTHRRLAPGEVARHAAMLHALQRAAYRVEAALIDDDRIPALHESADDLVAARLHWVMELEHDRVVGAIGYATNDDVIEIDRLIVDPDCHRRGIGTRLVTHVLADGRGATVSTGRENAPARRLYEAVGFIHIADREVLPGLVVSDYAARPGSESPR